MHLIDTHSHIYLKEFTEDYSEMIKRADNEGIKSILLPAIDSSTHIEMMEFESTQTGNCKAMMGVHPCSIKENFEDELLIAKNYLEKRPFIAVGEIGLDFYWDKTFAKQQYEAFNQQIEWALHFDLPIAIHSRNSIDECIDVVAAHQKASMGKLRGVFHCFSGDVEQANKIIQLGFSMGVGGVVTFKNSGLDKVMNEISLDHIVLETDAPYLAPMPFRGKRNEPSYLKYVVEKLAELKNSSKEEIAEITSGNAMKLFNLIK